MDDQWGSPLSGNLHMFWRAKGEGLERRRIEGSFLPSGKLT